MVANFQKECQMKVRRKDGVRIRPDSFGGVCYVPHRDDFFAANHQTFLALKRLKVEWAHVEKEWKPTFIALAKLGICETASPRTTEIAYSGPSFLGKLPELPTVSEPLVLNCFCTAHCPLSCIYCHADDLMKKFRSGETEGDLENVAATASMVPAIVAVITGGDPLTRPERATYLIERLAKQKALVLDTSGVGDIESLMHCLKKHKVHIRVSLDTISPVNDKLRPANPNYTTAQNSGIEAQITIEKCLANDLPVTVQTVITSRNENDSEWFALRDWLVSKGVRNWVLHVAVKGGNARRIENRSMLQQRPRPILPSPQVYSKLWRLVEDTQRHDVPIDIRCTDTDTSPNSVLLIGSKGDLYTEGYAFSGKVLLYSAGDARPDLVRALWPHIDRFGHAKRYLNWNPWFFGGRSIDEICYEVPIPPQTLSNVIPVVETEAKYKVNDPQLLHKLLNKRGFQSEQRVWQRDEYFDTEAGAIASLDFVVRLRKQLELVEIGFKGPRFFTPEGEYSRIEIEVPAGAEEAVRKALVKNGLSVTWFFEKRRATYTKPKNPVQVVIDEIPEIGFFAEIEGPIANVRETIKALSAGLSTKERRNYAELFRDFKVSQGFEKSTITGASFEAQD
jgi:predicted adenylyl cyclase CyaB